MPSFNVPLQGGGEMTVNASDAAAAMENVQAQGGTPRQGGSVFIDTTRTGGGTDYPTGGGGGDQQALNQLVAGQEALLKAIADGNHQAFLEAVRQFDLSFGLDQNKFSEAVRQFNESLGVTAAGLTGVYQGQPTQQAQALQAQMLGRFQGQPTLAAQQQAFEQGTGLVGLTAGLQANPFRQQQAMGQLNRLLSGQSVAGFADIGTVPGAGTGGLGYLQQMIDDIKSPGANTANMNEVLQGIPTPTKLDSTQFFRAPTTTQNLVLQGMQEKYGIDPNDALQQIKNTMPGFQAPNTFGTIRR